MNIAELLDYFWNDYISITPMAKEIHTLLESHGEEIVNDHIAFRTFESRSIGMESFEVFFRQYGYERRGEYDFELKKLNAIHLENKIDPELPKIFISELRYKELSEEAIQIIERELVSIENRPLNELLFTKSTFSISSEEYIAICKQSEYAAWLLAMGFRANHFTVFVNKLKNFNNIKEINDLLIKEEIPLNISGGMIKGSPNVYLEQSSTMASKQEIQFSDKALLIPTCYYEFALRYELSNGKLYSGFVTDSADKIFEVQIMNWLNKTPIAHRGLHGNGVPENSLKSFEKAIEKNYAIELDTRLSSDGEVIVFHDPTTGRLVDKDVKINETSFNELKSMHLEGTESKIPSFKEVLELVNSKVPILVEIKNEGSVGSLEDAVIQLLDQYPGEFAIQSFNPLSLKYISKKRPTFKVGMLAGSFSKSKLSILKKYILKYMLFTPYLKPDFFSVEYGVDIWMQQSMMKLYSNRPVLYWTIKDQMKASELLNDHKGVIFEGFEFK